MPTRYPVLMTVVRCTYSLLRTVTYNKLMMMMKPAKIAAAARHNDNHPSFLPVPRSSIFFAKTNEFLCEEDSLT